MRKVNEKTIDLIKSFEGLFLKAYPDPGTVNDPIKKGKPITIGYGTTKYPDGRLISLGDVITEPQALEYLAFEVNQKAAAVEKLLRVVPNDNQFGALVSFAYNLGEGNLSSSTLLKKCNVNPDDESIRAEFLKWNKANSKVMAGLTRRRIAEADLYFS